MADLKSTKDLKKRDYPLLQKFDLFLWEKGKTFGDGFIAIAKRNAKKSAEPAVALFNLEKKLANAAKTEAVELWANTKIGAKGAAKKVDDFFLKGARERQRSEFRTDFENLDLSFLESSDANKQGKTVTAAEVLDALGLGTDIISLNLVSQYAYGDGSFSRIIAEANLIERDFETLAILNDEFFCPSLADTPEEAASDPAPKIFSIPTPAGPRCPSPSSSLLPPPPAYRAPNGRP